MIDPKAKSSSALLKTFLEAHFIKSLQPYIKFNLKTGKGSSAPRYWPESEIDRVIKEKKEEKRRKEEEERRLAEERRK